MKKVTNVVLDENYKYLSDYYTELPKNCLLNKGITGCGGTTVELKSKRNSIILVPNINLIENKLQSNPEIIPLYSSISDKEFEDKLKRTKGYKKIVSTYDGLRRLLMLLHNYEDWFLLVDEYHILFNLYSFRNDAISRVLSNYHKFQGFCFMTATPLKEENILDELQDIDIINIDWTWKTKVKINIVETTYTSRALIDEINKCLSSDYNLHIFLNSVETIKYIVKNTSMESFRTVCGKESRKKNGQIKAKTITSPIQKINFYTSTAFEGVDIYDEKGKTIIISDSKISTTLLDISTLLVQICGRLRNSIYKDEITYIVNAFNNRYLTLTEKAFYNDVNTKVGMALAKERAFENGEPQFQEFELKTFKEDDYNYYVNCDGVKVYYDNNLKKLDINNYYILRVYTSTVSVLKEINESDHIYSEEAQKPQNPLLKNIVPYFYYSYSDLEELLVDTFESNHIPFSPKTLNKHLGMYFDKKRKQINGIRSTYYYFKF